MAWRPETIFGPAPGRNDLVNQRVTGEIHLDEFDVSHTKDDIVWQGEEEDAVESLLREQCAEIVKLAREYRQAELAPVAPEQKLSLEAAIEGTGLAEAASGVVRTLAGIFDGLVPASVEDAADAGIAKLARSERDVIVLQLTDGASARVVTTSKCGRDAPYLTLSVLSKKVWLVTVNASHPACPLPDDLEALRLHMQHVLADAVAMWALRTAAIPGRSLSVVKDALLRGMAGDRS